MAVEDSIRGSVERAYVLSIAIQSFLRVMDPRDQDTSGDSDLAHAAFVLRYLVAPLVETRDGLSGTFVRGGLE